MNEYMTWFTLDRAVDMVWFSRVIVQVSVRRFIHAMPAWLRARVLSWTTELWRAWSRRIDVRGASRRDRATQKMVWIAHLQPSSPMFLCRALFHFVLNSFL